MAKLFSAFQQRPRVPQRGANEGQSSLREALRNRGGAQKPAAPAPTDIEDNYDVKGQQEVKEDKDKVTLDWLNLTAFPAQALQNAINNLSSRVKDGTETDGGESAAETETMAALSAVGRIANPRRHSIATPKEAPAPKNDERSSLRSALASRGGITRRPKSDDHLVSDAEDGEFTSSVPSADLAGEAEEDEDVVRLVSSAPAVVDSPHEGEELEPTVRSPIAAASPTGAALLPSVAEEQEAEAEAEEDSPAALVESEEVEDATPASPTPEAEDATPASPTPEAEDATAASPTPEAEEAAVASPAPEAEVTPVASPTPEAEAAPEEQAVDEDLTASEVVEAVTTDTAIDSSPVEQEPSAELVAADADAEPVQEPVESAVIAAVASTAAPSGASGSTATAAEASASHTVQRPPQPTSAEAAELSARLEARRRAESDAEERRKASEATTDRGERQNGVENGTSQHAVPKASQNAWVRRAVEEDTPSEPQAEGGGERSRPPKVVKRMSWVRPPPTEDDAVEQAAPKASIESKKFRDLNEFWTKNAKGFAGPAMGKGNRVSKNEAQATLQRLIAAGSKVDFNEVRRLRKLIDEAKD